jgi:hypothetical protein
MPEETQDVKVERLNTIFLAGPGGLVYEIPREEAAKFAVTPQRIKELGHLPIAPYEVQTGAAHHSHAHAEPGATGAETQDVEGRHLAWNPVLGVWVWHVNCLFGAFVAANGFVYTGVHYHPYGNELGVLC